MSAQATARKINKLVDQQIPLLNKHLQHHPILLRFNTVQDPVHVVRHVRVHRRRLAAAVDGSEGNDADHVVFGGPVDDCRLHQRPPGIAAARVEPDLTAGAQLPRAHRGELPQGLVAVSRVDDGDADVEQEGAGAVRGHIVHAPTGHLHHGTFVIHHQQRSLGHADGRHES
jgi:hypothetical protein